MANNTHSPEWSHRKDDNASAIDHVSGIENTAGIIVGPPISLRELGEILIRAQAKAFLQSYDDRDRAARAAEQLSTREVGATEVQILADEDLPIEFFARGLPSPR